MTIDQWQRLKFVDVAVEHVDTKTVRVTVSLKVQERGTVTGTSEGSSTEHGTMRGAALATVEAVCRGVDAPEGDIQFLGLRSIQAFDATVVIVALAARFDAGMQRLVGAYFTEEDLVRGGALAVLNATNRYLGSPSLPG